LASSPDNAGSPWLAISPGLAPHYVGDTYRLKEAKEAAAKRASRRRAKKSTSRAKQKPAKR